MPKITAMAALVPMQLKYIFLMRLYCPAPKFCEVNVVAVCETELQQVKIMLSTLPDAVLPAIAAAPNELIEDWIITFEREKSEP